MKNWRSIRKYLDKQICDDAIKQLLKSGKEKLDIMGDKLWSFTVIQSKEQIDEINKLTKLDMKENSDVDIITRLGKTSDFDIFYGAPTVIMVSVKDKSKGLISICGDSVHNIVNKAKKLGLATNWNSFIKYHFFDKTTLDIPEDYTPYYAISVGYANQQSNV